MLSHDLDGSTQAVMSEHAKYEFGYCDVRILIKSTGSRSATRAVQSETFFFFPPDSNYALECKSLKFITF